MPLSQTGAPANQPVIEFRSATTPFGVLVGLQLTGSGYNGAVPLGTTSSAATLRLYNNFAGAAGIHDAFNCVLAAYDDALNWGAQATTPVAQQWLLVQVLDYDGTTTGADAAPVAIGGAVKHALPTNGGTLAGAAAHYSTLSVSAAVPIGASASAVTEGIWLEYSWT